MNHKKLICRLSAICLICLLLCGSIFAQSIEVSPKSPYAISVSVFATEADTLPDGIYISALPAAEVCTVAYNNRTLHEGDVLSASALQNLTVCSTGLLQTEAEMEYRPIISGTLEAAQTLCFHLLKAQNTTPIAQDDCFETYKNISYTGTLIGSDADGDTLVFALEKAPKHGNVVLSEDGSFVYTPQENKVGRDRFTFIVTDPDGNASAPATVEIKIRKTTAEASYTDLSGTTDAFYAVWLQEQGAFSGKTLAGNYVFEPNSTVSRGDFLVMAMKVLGKTPENGMLSSGFADALSAPSYLRPYMAQALRCGYISGSSSEDGLVFRAEEPISYAEAAVMVQNIVKLPENALLAASYLSTDAVPAWAGNAVGALSSAGITLTIPEDGTITRMECAKLLWQASKLTCT